MSKGTKPMTLTKVTLEEAIAEDSCDWLAANAPRMVDAIHNSLISGLTPEQIRWVVSENVGPDRQGLALRCYQAARWMRGEFREEA
jgi:hypothetical protein